MLVGWHFVDSDFHICRYEFELIYLYDDGTRDVLRWTQESWVDETSVTNADLSQIVDTRAAEPYGFTGLAKSSSPTTYADGSYNHNNWWHAVGSVVLHGGGIPGHEGVNAYHSELWARRGVCVWLACRLAFC